MSFHGNTAQVKQSLRTHKITIKFYAFNVDFFSSIILLYLRLVSSVVPPEERVCEVVTDE